VLFLFVDIEFLLLMECLTFVLKVNTASSWLALPGSLLVWKFIQHCSSSK